MGVSLARAALVALGKLDDDAANKHHQNEGLVGWTPLSLRFVLYVWFIVGIRSSQQKGGFRLHAFLQQFRTAGSIYFLAYPSLFVIVQLFAPYLQHPVMQTGLLAMQTVSHFWLSRLFLSRGAYFNASVLSSSLLPGCFSSSCIAPQKEA